jgi:hypothetical protein
MGVERIQELLHYSKNIKTPRMNVYLLENHNNKIYAGKVVNHFLYLEIKKLISDIEIYYDVNNDSKLHNLLKNDNVSNPFFVDGVKTDLINLPFVFRLKISSIELLKKKMTLLDIKIKFISFWNKNYTNLKKTRVSITKYRTATTVLN